MIIGTLINFAAVIVGGTLGLLLGQHFPERMKIIVISALGLMTISLGIAAAIKTENALIPLLALVLGAIIGELMDIDRGINHLGDWLKKRFERPDSTGNFTLAFVLASLQFCVGPLTILGSINDGLSGDFSLLAIKSVLDGFSAIIFASTFGIGTLFAAGTVLIVQGSISLLAGLVKPLLVSNPGASIAAQPRVIELSAVGGVILIGLAFNILDLKRIKVANMLPALIIAPLIVALLNIFGIPLDFGLGGK
jgi:uncharacterized membrane protein YqgA involved in biofilm formation